MSSSNLWLLWSNNAGVSTGIWFIIIVTLMYFGRTPAHEILRGLARLLRNGFRYTSRSINSLSKRLQQRNKEVILTAGKESTERLIEREFHRVNAVVERDLSSYPALHRQISDSINRIEEDYRGSTETPPSPPAWLDAVETIAKIPRTGDPTIGRILDDIHDTIERAHKDTLKEYRKSSLGRHDLLKKMLPAWRRLSQDLNDVKSTIEGIQERSKIIDHQMETYEEIRQGNDRAARMLTSSSLTQFFISGLVLFIAIMGGIINFQLIALPMSEMVGGTAQLGPLSTADVAALVIIMVEVAMGLFLMESLRITRLFPIIGTMEDQMRRRMILITFTILAILASVEASLAYMRDLLAADREALTQSLAGMEIVQAQFRWIPSIGQMVMGFILPFALAFVAIPLESFIHSSRTVLGLTGIAVLRLLSFLARLCGHIAFQGGNLLVNFYDLVIFLPLKIEHHLHQRQQLNLIKAEKPDMKKLATDKKKTESVKSSDGVHTL
ncbi:MAG: hypothetical protein OEZ58_05250 [Gammaproteobacteria bacterium]|nr:hypothetical protein [Gammaproteobacteria bacterium]MDH5728371.1 hypothetical protein [Gammaproteobacteria bacterium]